MNRDDIIRMAGHREVPPWVLKLVMDCVEVEREACVKLCQELGKKQTRRMKMKVSFEMEDAQVDAILVQVLEDHIVYTYTDFFWHTEDREYNEKLKEALWVVFDYFAGEEAAKDLKNSVEDKYDDGEEDERETPEGI